MGRIQDKYNQTVNELV